MTRLEVVFWDTGTILLSPLLESESNTVGRCTSTGRIVEIGLTRLTWVDIPEIGFDERQSFPSVQ